MNFVSKAGLVAAVALLLSPMAASANQVTPVAVSANVVPFCVNLDLGASADKVAFGAYNVFNNFDVKTTGILEFECTKGTNATLSVDGGTYGNGSQRRMSNGTSFLNYNLYKDAGDSVAWTSGQTIALNNNSGYNQFPFNGVLPQQQNVTTGNYSDTVTITLNY
ncbi:MAG TPA: spore coat U domain-containing protein [Candidatus Baltobacteraceae bacterium]|jgi:spore coat protein U-like protein